jgi:ABC-type transport system involved in multi-copper enzyme maturation permease subunit
MTTAKESMSQPLFYVVLLLGSFALLAFIFIPYNTFGEDVKVLKDSGLTLIMVLSMIVAVWSASVSVSEEVEGRTALTVLSKPVRRRQFILGKFLAFHLDCGSLDSHPLTSSH